MGARPSVGFAVSRPLVYWRQGPAPFYFPEYLIQWPLFALGADLLSVLLFAPLVYAVLSAIGWILVCGRLFGRLRRARRLFCWRMPRRC